MTNGFFLILEGIEGVGKSTCLKFIANHLRRYGIKPKVTREPGGTALGEQLRAILLHHDYANTGGMPIMPEAELLLLFAARVQHIRQVIEPALQAGEFVISDRFTESSYAYQGGGRGVKTQKIAQLEKWLHFLPSAMQLTLLLNAPVEIALQRIRQRKITDHIENETAEFFKRAQCVYLNRAKKSAKSCILIDTHQKLVNVKKQIINALAQPVKQYLEENA